MEASIKAGIEKNFSTQLDGLLKAVRKKVTSSALNTPAKVNEFSRNISPTVGSLIKPSEWIKESGQGLSRGLARNMDMVVGYDLHLVSISIPPLPVPIVIGPIPIPFAGMIRIETKGANKSGLPKVSRLSPAGRLLPVYINGKKSYNRRTCKFL